VDPTRGLDVMPVGIQSRPKGVRSRHTPLPKGVDGRKVVAILTGSNYQVASRIWIDAGRELALRVIVDTGSRVFLVREALLPPVMKVAPLHAATAQLFDVNGGLLPITGTVPLTVRVGIYSTPVTCGVVRCMSVPLLLRTDYTDVHVPNICGPEGYIRLLNGYKVPILRRGKTVSYARADQPRKSDAASEADARVRLFTRWSYPRGPGDTSQDRRHSKGMGSSPSAIECMSATACMLQLAPWTAAPTRRGKWRYPIRGTRVSDSPRA